MNKRSPIWQMPSQDFAKLIESSVDMKSVLGVFGLRNKGGNYRTLKSRCEEEGVSYDHLWKNKSFPAWSRELNKEDIVKLFFVENSSAPRISIRRYCQKFNLIEYKCECGNKGSWCNKPLALQLDHINGIDNDHRVENLRWLCPNCHSQTNTYAGKNKY